jgi:hypothetical protein
MDDKQNALFQSGRELTLAEVLGGQSLAQFLEQVTLKGLYYYRKPIYLDGLIFEECSFENCQFIIAQGTFSLIDCRIYGPETQFLYQGAALKVARLFELMNASAVGRIVFPAIFPPRDKDGRVTIR